MEISIIIPTFNRSNTLLKTLKSFIAQNYPKDKYEIIVVDNNSTDGTRTLVDEFIKNANGVRIIYIFEKRQGVHYARNTAAKHAHYGLLYYTDDDMIADPNLLSEIIKPFEFDGMVADVTGRVLPLWEVEPPKWILKHCYNSLLSILDPPEDFLITKDISYLYSCHQAIRKDVFIACEGFNPEYVEGVYWGDGETGLNIKVKNLGYKFGYNGRALIYHMIPPQRMTQQYLNKRIGNNGNAQSYTEFRQQIPGNFRLCAKIVKRTFIVAPIHLLKYLMKTIAEQDSAYLRFLLAYIIYYYNRLVYDLKIITNPNWRSFVLKKDWLSNDNESL